MIQSIRNLSEEIFIAKSQKYKFKDRASFWISGYVLIVLNKFSSKEKSNRTDTASKLQIDKYKGNNKCVIKIINLLENFKSPIIKKAFIHGSIASNEIIEYSDVDTVLIINCKNINSRSSLQKYDAIIKATYKEMLLHDPLQHHGWRIIDKSKIATSSNIILPKATISELKSIFFNGSSSLYQNNKQSKYTINSFNNISNSITQKLSNFECLNNMFLFKILISETLLLPTIYLQYKLQEDISKKESFDRIREFIDINQQKTLSAIEIFRKNWKNPIVDIDDPTLAALQKMQQEITTPDNYMQWLKENKSNITSLVSYLKSKLD